MRFTAKLKNFANDCSGGYVIPLLDMLFGRKRNRHRSRATATTNHHRAKNAHKEPSSGLSADHHVLKLLEVHHCPNTSTYHWTTSASPKLRTADVLRTEHHPAGTKRLNTTLTELRYIVAVAQNVTSGRAARLCFVNSHPLHRHQKLEEELSTSLFDRGNNDIITTRQAFCCRQARQVLEEVTRPSSTA